MNHQRHLNHNKLRLAANARFAANALDEALPLYSLAVDVVRCRILLSAASTSASAASTLSVVDETAAAATDSNDNISNYYCKELIIQLCNRSACHYKMEMYNEAKIDALEAVELCAAANNTTSSSTGSSIVGSGGIFSKALFRLARSQLALGEDKDATDSIARALTHCDERLINCNDDNVKLMLHPTKKQRLNDSDGCSMGNLLARFDDLNLDELANIFGFLPVNGIMHSRRINKKSREAVKMTTVPPTNFYVKNVERYNAMSVMTRALPNLKQITLGHLGCGHKWSDGEDPDEELIADTAHYTSHDIQILSNFRQLHTLEICEDLNGRYPFLFTSPLLQKLTINYCYGLKWDLGMLAGMPSLKELECADNRCLSGNINSLRVLKDTLKRVKIVVANVEGNFMDLADFPSLKELNLDGTAVTGDIQDIGQNDFLSLEILRLPKTVYGGKGYELQRIADAPNVARAVYLLKKQRPALEYYWYGKLSEDSLDWYESVEAYHLPPFTIRLVQAGTRVGYAWTTDIGYRWQTRFNARNHCEANWLDPEPDRAISEYGQYIEELQAIEAKVNFYRGFHQPPTEEEYESLLDEHYGEGIRGV